MKAIVMIQANCMTQYGDCISKDPTVSTAPYATLDSSADVDYYTFRGRRGQSILRYLFVIGDKERPGGDPAFVAKMGDYWTPVPQPVAVQPSAQVMDSHRCGRR